MTQESSNPFCYLGEFDKSAAEELIEKLETKEIEYEIELNKSDIDQFDIIRAPEGGPLGTGVHVFFYVHRDHWDMAQEIIAKPLTEDGDAS